MGRFNSIPDMLRSHGEHKMAEQLERNGKFRRLLYRTDSGIISHLDLLGYPYLMSEEERKRQGVGPLMIEDKDLTEQQNDERMYTMTRVLAELVDRHGTPGGPIRIIQEAIERYKTDQHITRNRGGF